MPSDPPHTLPVAPGPLLGTVTITGYVHQGAEPGCLFVQTARGQYELVNPTPVPREGDEVRVVGHLLKAMSHCMDGQPLFVQQLTIGHAAT